MKSFDYVVKNFFDNGFNFSKGKVISKKKVITSDFNLWI
jgi:hypothetical protein